MDAASNMMEATVADGSIRLAAVLLAAPLSICAIIRIITIYVLALATAASGPCGSVLLERYYRELLNFLNRQVNDRDIAADLAQESYARVLAVQNSGRSILDPRALLYQTARNLMVDQHRRTEVRRHDDLDALPETEQPAAPPHLEPDAALASQQVLCSYVRAIEQLPPRCREAFVLHVFDELTHAQVAARMGISVSMVEKHVVRGMLSCKLCEHGLKDSNRSTPATD